MNCLWMLSTDDFTSQHYRCDCHRPPSCQEVCGPGVPMHFMVQHGSLQMALPRHLDALNARLHARQALNLDTFCKRPQIRKGPLLKIAGTPPCKDQWVKNSAEQMKDRISEIFCET